MEECLIVVASYATYWIRVFVSWCVGWLQWAIHDFHNGGQLGKNGNYNIRARPVRPQQNKHGRVSNIGRIASRRKDIPRASLCGQKPSELKNEELKLWLKCRGDPAKGLKTKAELVKRWEFTLFPLPSSLASRLVLKCVFIPFSEWKSTSSLVEIKVLLTLIPMGCIPKESSNKAVHRQHQA